MILSDIFQRNVRRYPQKTGVVFRSNRFTFDEFNRRINSLANALIDLVELEKSRCDLMKEIANGE